MDLNNTSILITGGTGSLGKELTKDILTLGGSFFFIQVAVLLIFTVDSFMILQLLGPTHVTTYNIVYKLFGGKFM